MRLIPLITSAGTQFSRGQCYQHDAWMSPWTIIVTFRSEDEDDYEYVFSVLNMRIRFGGRHFSKCACSEQKTRTRSRPRPPILRSLIRDLSTSTRSSTRTTFQF